MQMQELAQKYQAWQKMSPDADGYKALGREVLLAIDGMTPGEFSEFLGNLPYMYAGRGNKWESIIRPEEARLLIKNKFNY